jgi:hypothetical protein
MDPEIPPGNHLEDEVLLTMADAPAVAWLLSIRPREFSPAPQGTPDAFDEMSADVAEPSSPNRPLIKELTPTPSIASASPLADLPRDPTRWATPSAGLDSLGREARPVNIEVGPGDLPNWPMPRPTADLSPATRHEARPVPAWREQVDRPVPTVRDALPVDLLPARTQVIRQGLLPTPQGLPPAFEPVRAELPELSTTSDRLRANLELGPIRDSLPTPLGLRRRGPLD